MAPRSYKIVAGALHALLGRAQSGLDVTGELIESVDTRWRALRRDLPRSAELMLDPSVDEPPLRDPWQELIVELDDDGRLRRKIEVPIGVLLDERLQEIDRAVKRAFDDYADSVTHVIELLADWMARREIVHVIGAGRALLAASLPANRLAHGGANVYILGDKSPPPNSRFGGAILAASASGRTRSVLEIMSFAKRLNDVRGPDQQITIVGVSDPDAKGLEPFEPFRDLCSPRAFVGVKAPENVALRGLGDLEELAIAQLLDALVVLAGFRIGANFRIGHEDLVGGATGPWHQN